MPDKISQTPDAMKAYESASGKDKKTLEKQAAHLKEQARKASTEGDKTLRKESETSSKQNLNRVERHSQGLLIKREAPREGQTVTFLKKLSVEQQQRDAGKDFTRSRTHTSTNVRHWAVANSPSLSDRSREALLTRMDARKAFHDPHRGFDINQHLRLQNLSARDVTITRGFKAYQHALANKPLIIRYANATLWNQQNLTKILMPRQTRFDQAFRQAQKLVQERLSQQTSLQRGDPIKVIVHVRGTLVFVQDGKKFRAFRIKDNGELHEMHGEDASGEPLSAEARQQLRRVLQARGLRDHQTGQAKEELQRTAEGRRLASQESSQKALEGGLDFESKFALLLQKVLEEKFPLGKKLADGEDPEFPVKEDWEGFFAKMFGLGNEERLEKKTMDSLLSLLFRGVYQKKGMGNVLVGDLKFLRSGKAKEEKFTQLNVEDQHLLETLFGLKPGQKISLDQLKKAFGDELAYLKLAHIVAEAKNDARGYVFNPKGQINLAAQAQLEAAIFASAKKTIDPNTKNSRGDSQDPSPYPKTVFANVYELLRLHQRHPGRPRLYVLIAYIVMSLSIGGLILWTVLQFM